MSENQGELTPKNIEVSAEAQEALRVLKNEQVSVHERLESFAGVKAAAPAEEKQ